MFFKNYTLWFQKVLVILLMSVVFVIPTSGDTYTQWTQATIGNMTSETDANLPADRSRTEIGIGEQVTCSINPNSWSDYDCNVTQNQIEFDTIGDRVWTCTSGGEISPSGVTQSDSTTLTADMSPGSVYVHVNVHDCFEGGEGYLYPDLPALAGINFTILAPSSYNPVNHWDEDVGWTKGPPDKMIGASSVFKCVVEPTSVNFYNVSFHETWATQYWNWPDGTTGERAAGTTDYTLLDDGDEHNWAGDLSLTGLYPKSKLDSDPGHGVDYDPCNFGFDMEHKYKNKDDEWIWYDDAVHYRHYEDDLTCSVELDNVLGNAQGPWKK